jgi:hypothetical protein
MEENLIHYLTLISKLSDILDYINKNFEENDISLYIKECKSLCIDKVKSHYLIELFLHELNQKIYEENLENIKKEEVETEETEDKNIKDTIDNFSMLMKTSNSTDMSPEIFDSLGSGIIKLLRPNDQSLTKTIEITPQIKNELNTVNTNINIQIKKKHEH